jgi:hypothetical protein
MASSWAFVPAAYLFSSSGLWMLVKKLLPWSRPGQGGMAALHKTSEIYDRIAFAAVGRYDEYENMRKAAVTCGNPPRYLGG